MSQRGMITQHGPLGELPAGCHPTQWEFIHTRDNGRARMYSRYTRPGDLVFDIGANIGEVTSVFLELGCKVVAVEPQGQIAKEIDKRAEVKVGVCGAAVGYGEFWEIPNAPYLSTMRKGIADFALQTNGDWQPQQVQVEVFTLDQLIEEYGKPVFIKIDVEGFEAEVLRGLSQPVQALSFEVHNFDKPKIGQCIDRLNELGDYGYLYSRGEGYELEMFPPPEFGWFGDVYASLREQI